MTHAALPPAAKWPVARAGFQGTKPAFRAVAVLAAGRAGEARRDADAGRAVTEPARSIDIPGPPVKCQPARPPRRRRRRATGVSHGADDVSVDPIS